MGAGGGERGATQGGRGGVGVVRAVGGGGATLGAQLRGGGGEGEEVLAGVGQVLGGGRQLGFQRQAADRHQHHKLGPAHRLRDRLARGAPRNDGPRSAA